MGLAMSLKLGVMDCESSRREVKVEDVAFPRVAICFSGQARTLKPALPDIKKLVDALAPADVIASVASEEDKMIVMNLLAPKRCEVRPVMPDGDLMEKLGENPNFTVKKDALADLKDEQDRKKQAWVNGMIFFSIKHAHTLAVEEEGAREQQYEVIVRIRYDLLFQENTVAQVRQALKELDAARGAEPIVIVPTINNFGGVNDQFGIGNRKGMQAYADTFTKYHDLAKNASTDPGFSNQLQTEVCLQAALADQNVDVRHREGILARILRDDGTPDPIAA